METNYKMADGSQMVLSDLLSSSLTGEMPQMVREGEGMSTSEGFTFSSSSTLKNGGIPQLISLPHNNQTQQHQLLSLPPNNINDSSPGVPRQLSDMYPGVDALFRKISHERINNNNNFKNTLISGEVPKTDERPPPLLKLANDKDTPQYQPFLAPPVIKSVIAPPTFLTTCLSSSKPPNNPKVPRPINYKEWVELVLPNIPTRPFVPKLLPPPSVAPPLLKLDDPLSKMRANGFKLLTLPSDRPNMQHVHVRKSRQQKRQLRFKSPDHTVTTTTKATPTKITSSSDEIPSSPESSLSNKPRPSSPNNEQAPPKEISQTLPSNKPRPQDTRLTKNQLTLSAIKHVNISTSEEEEEEQLLVSSGTLSPSHHSPTPRSGTPPHSPSPRSPPPCSPSPPRSPSRRSPSLSPPPITRQIPSLKSSIAIQVNINEPHSPNDGPRLYTDVIDIEEEEEEEEVLMVTDRVARTPPIPRRHYGNRPDDVMKQFELLEKQLSLLEANAEDIRDDFMTSRRVRQTTIFNNYSMQCTCS